jgi:hypothetical protein
MALRILGLDPAPFVHLYGLTDAELATRGVIRQRVDEPHSAPDRIELRDAEPGETVLLLNHEYLAVDSPYRGRHAIFVREGARQRFDAVGEVPDAMRDAPPAALGARLRRGRDDGRRRRGGGHRA